MSSFLDPKLLARVAEIARTPKAKAGLAAFLLLALVPRLNRWLSRRSVNNYAIDKSWDWTKELVVLTGGSSGIGAKILSRLEKDNVKVINLDVNPPEGPTGPNTTFYQVDLSSASEISSVADLVRATHGDPTVLINNAGMGIALPLLELTDSSVRRIFDVNMLAPMLLAKRFLPAMVARDHGHVVNVSSMAAFATQACNVPYACTKSGVLVLHEGLVQECRHVYKAPSVRATVVHPSWIETPMTRELIDSGKFREKTTSPDVVARIIVDQLYSGYGAQIIIPPSLGWVPSVRGFPTWVQEKFRDGITIGFLRGIDRL